MSIGSCSPSPTQSSLTAWKSVRSSPGMSGGGGESAALPGAVLTLSSHSVGPNGTTFHSFQPFEKNLTGEQAGPNVLQPYAAYAPPGTPKVSWGPPPPTYYDILALLGSLPPHSEAGASEEFFKWSLKPPPLILPRLFIPILHQSWWSLPKALYGTRDREEGNHL